MSILEPSDELAQRTVRLEQRLAILERQVEALSRGNLERSTFAFKGRTFAYALERGNRAYANERAVELPIAKAAVDAFSEPGSLVEVGNVLAHYYETSHAVVDKYEHHEKVTDRVDVLDFVPESPLGLVVSVSTLEHVGFSGDDREEGKFARAVERVASWLRPDGMALITVPLGYNPEVDDFVRAPSVPAQIRRLRRISGFNEWREASQPEVEGVRYGRPYPFANAIAVVELHGSEVQRP